MPRLVRREARGPGRTRHGFDVDLRWDPQRGVAQLAIALSDGEAMIELTRETLRNLIDLATEADAALDAPARALPGGGTMPGIPPE